MTVPSALVRLGVVGVLVGLLLLGQNPRPAAAQSYLCGLYPGFYGYSGCTTLPSLAAYYNPWFAFPTYYYPPSRYPTYYYPPNRYPTYYYQTYFYLR